MPNLRLNERKGKLSVPGGEGIRWVLKGAGSYAWGKGEIVGLSLYRGREEENITDKKEGERIFLLSKELKTLPLTQKDQGTPGSNG